MTVNYKPIDLYSDASMSHSGTVDTGKGVGLGGTDAKPNPGFSAWSAYNTWPTGIQESPVDYVLDNGYLYIFYNGTDGSGRSVARFTMAADGSFILDGSAITIATLGMAGIWMDEGCAHYDSATGSIIICTYATSGTGNTPVVKKYSFSNWPWTNANHDWSSPLQQSYGSFVSGQLTGRGPQYWDKANNRFYITSRNSGQVITLDTTDGSVYNVWEFYGAYSANYPFQFLGITSTGKPIGGSYHASGGNQNAYSWNVGTPWTTDTLLLPNSNVPDWWLPNYERMARRGYSTRFYVIPLSVSDRDILGLSASQCAFWIPNRQFQYGEPLLVLYDPTESSGLKWQERPIAHSSTRRSLGNWNHWPFGYRFITHGGIPWFVTWSAMSADIEDSNPGGPGTEQLGLVLSPIGPGTVTYTLTASGAHAPLGMAITLEKTATNYLMSESRQKHRFRQKIGAGAWSDWRCGEQEIGNLDSVVNGKAAWTTWAKDDVIYIEHQLCAGWPYTWDQLVKTNPDFVSQVVNTADVAPPREVRPVLWTDYQEVELVGL